MHSTSTTHPIPNNPSMDRTLDYIKQNRLLPFRKNQNYQPDKSEERVLAKSVLSSSIEVPFKEKKDYANQPQTSTQKSLKQKIQERLQNQSTAINSRKGISKTDKHPPSTQDLVISNSSCIRRMLFEQEQTPNTQMAKSPQQNQVNRGQTPIQKTIKQQINKQNKMKQFQQRQKLALETKSKKQQLLKSQLRAKEMSPCTFKPQLTRYIKRS